VKNNNRIPTSDIGERIRRNLTRLRWAIIAFITTFMAVTGLFFYLLYKSYMLAFSFWVLLSFFWLACLLHLLWRYFITGRWVGRIDESALSWKTDQRLQNALDAMKLASGMDERIDLFVIPDADINAFSIMRPDKTYALLVTQGVADKLPPREREALIAHEIAHMRCGDTRLQSSVLRLSGYGSLNARRLDPDKVYAKALGLIILFVAGLWLFGYMNLYLFYVGAFFCILLIIGSPFLVRKTLQLALDRDRDYYADLEAAYLTRDPEAAYLALKDAAYDVEDMLFLPACFDSLLFHPVVSVDYWPFRTQPEMRERMNRLREAFPQIET